MNTTVSFEIAELLQEKRIVIYSDYRYTDFKGIIRLERDASAVFPFAPTIADVVMWLYEKHGVWISVLHKRRSENKYFDYEIKLPNGMEIYSWDHNSPTEAGEAAIEYTLNELI